MALLDFWNVELKQEELKAIRFLEHLILALEKEWFKYEKINFTDWNTKFRNLNFRDINPQMNIPMKDAKIEKKEFSKIWRETIETFNKAISLIKKGKKDGALILVFSRTKDLENQIMRLAEEEKNTEMILRQYYELLQRLFDNNYGPGFFEKEVLKNYEIRFRILEILKNEYNLIRDILSDY